MEQLTSFISYVGVIAIGAERFTEIIKQAYLEKRKVPAYVYQLITFTCGFILSIFEPPMFSVLNFNQYTIAVITGLAVCSGSDIWHEVLYGLNNFRKSIDSKSIETKEQVK